MQPRTSAQPWRDAAEGESHRMRSETPNESVWRGVCVGVGGVVGGSEAGWGWGERSDLSGCKI